MKFFSLSLTIFGLLGLTAVNAQQIDRPNAITPPNIVLANPLEVITPYNMEDPAVKMPIIDFPAEGTKILVWTPKTDYHFNMPQAFSRLQSEVVQGDSVLPGIPDKKE